MCVVLVETSTLSSRLSGPPRSISGKQRLSIVIGQHRIIFAWCDINLARLHSLPCAACNPCPPTTFSFNQDCLVWFFAQCCHQPKVSIINIHTHTHTHTHTFSRHRNKNTDNTTVQRVVGLCPHHLSCHQVVIDRVQERQWAFLCCLHFFAVKHQTFLGIS